MLSYKADVNARDNKGLTPLDLVSGSREKLRLHTGSGSVYSFDDPALNERTAALLRQHGGQRDLPKTDRIEVRQPESGYTKAVFIQGTNDWNHFTLLEALYGNYISSPPDAPYPFFPNLHSIVVVRQDPNTGQSAKRIPVDLLSPTGAIRCDTDIPLQFGDVVEIPECEHTLQEPGIGLTRDELKQIVQCRGDGPKRGRHCFRPRTFRR